MVSENGLKSTPLYLAAYTGQGIAPWIEQLAQIRIRIFRDYPYLYKGSLAYEAEYLRHYAESPESLLVLAFKGETVIGASTAMPMRDYGAEVCKPFEVNGYHPEQIFYFGESVLDPAYRGQGIGVRFFEEREAHARRLGFTLVAFCAVDRPDSHPLRPPDYRTLDDFWIKRGYQKHPKLVTHFTWQDLDEAYESPKPLVFWLKALGRVTN